MNRVCRWMIVAAMLMLVGGAWDACGAAAPAEPGPRPIKFGVVNLQGVLDSLTEKKDIDVELRVDSQKANEARKSLKAEMDQLEKDITYFPLGSADRTKKEKELEAKKQKANEEMKLLVEELEKKRFRYTKKIYEKIVKQILDYAAAQNYDLILRSNEESLEEVTEGAELNYHIFQRVVLYTPKSNELSKIIADLLNKKYEEEKKAQK